MQITKLNEAGYEEALRGIALSYNQPLENMPAVAARLCHQDGGHNKFLESMVVWFEIRAPRYWWQQMDTYRAGSSKQSESTMHTLLKRPLTQDDFAAPLHPETLQRLNRLLADRQFEPLKNELPEGFLQRRIVCTNYKTLRNIILQRRSHRLPEWSEFIREVLRQVAHPELLPPLRDSE
jgi:hypothetical protein